MATPLQNPQYGGNSTAGPSDSSSFSTPSAQRTLAPGQGNGLYPQSLRRSPSPTKPTAPEPPKAVNTNTAKNDRPIDIRAEEDAARRYNIGRVVGNNRFGAVSRGKRTDLFGPELKMKLERMAKDHQVSFDEESLAYLSMAAETRLREVLSNSISAQQHRTTTSYLHPPPMASSSGSSSKPKDKERPMWAVSINSDPNALLEVLNKQAKEAERDFRTSRMTRLAREHEIERIRERQGDGPSAAPPDTSEQARAGSVGPGDDTNGPSANGNPASSPERGPSPLPTPAATATPTFGGVSAKKANSKNKKNPTFSPDVQIKMSNATAMRSTGVGKKYSWMNSAPGVSSPLSGRKKGKKGQAQGQDDEANDGEGQMLTAGTGDGDKKRKKSNLSNEIGAEEGNGNGKRAKKQRMPSLPSRRMVPVMGPTPSGPNGINGTNAPSGNGEERMVSDDRCLTVTDFVFALERDGSGKGMGTGDEIVRRAMARPGGPWGVSQRP